MIRPLRHLGLNRMRARDPREPGRKASSLELFFDLTFVICVSVSADHLLAREASDRWGSGAAAYAAVFFAIWWAWTTVTWFGSAYDTDDWLYRLTTFVQMAGVLVLAAGIGPAFDAGDFRIIVGAWVVMRLALVAQWLRSARDPTRRALAMRAAVATASLQVLWLLWAQVIPRPGQTFAATGLVLVLLELLVPVWANRGFPPPWHPQHLAERHSLFTLIVLGEGLLSAARAVLELQVVELRDLERLLLFGSTAFVLIAGLWWIYFAREASPWLQGERRLFTFGYVHYAVFASAGAVAAGLEPGVAAAAERGHVVDTTVVVRAATTVPVAIFVIATWGVVLRRSLHPWARRTILALALAIAACALIPFGVQAAAGAVVAVVVVLEVDGRHLAPERRSGTSILSDREA